MQFPLSFWDVGAWVAVTALVLLVTSEIAPSTKIMVIDKFRLRAVSIGMGIAFMFIVLVKFAEIIFSSTG